MKITGLLSLRNGSVFMLACLLILAGAKTTLLGDLSLDQEKGEANALLERYIQAFQAKSLTLASEVYAHDADLIVYGSSPSDRRMGWSQTEEYLTTYFSTVDSIEVVLKERNVKVHASRKVAWFAQVLKWKETEGGKTYTMDGLRISGVLEKRDRGWVIVQLHASGPPPVS